MPPRHGGSGGISSRRPPRPLRVRLAVAACLLLLAGCLGFRIAPPGWRWQLLGTHGLVALVSVLLVGTVNAILERAADSSGRDSRDGSRLEGGGWSADVASAGPQPAKRRGSPFLANITQELSTPLTLLLAPLGLIIDGQLGVLTPSQRSTLLSVQKNAFGLSRLIGDLVDLGKLAESRLRLRLDEHDLATYLRDLIAEIQPLAARKGISIELETGTPAARLWCDIERIERVFVSLFANAAKFTEAGGAVRVRIEDEGRSVRFQVSDVQSDAGTDLGLELARELVELHGGTTWAESSAGGGARFGLRLIKGKDHFSAEVQGQGSAAGQAGERHDDDLLGAWQLDARGQFRLMDVDKATEQRLLERDSDEETRPHTLLVVEDTPDVARVIRLALHHEFRFLAARDGEQGLELARRHRPTIIITERVMPTLDGIELTRRLRQGPETKHIPIVMLSAKSSSEDKIRSHDAGVSAYLAKPFSMGELVSIVRSLSRSQDVIADALLTQKMDSLETITGGLAHEINNPLNYLKNALASVERDCQTLVESVEAAGHGPPESGVAPKLVSRIHKMFEVSRAGVDRIASTVELMARYSREGYSRSPRAHDAFAAVRDVARIVSLTASREVKLTIELQGNGWIDCVPEEFNQVLSSLIQNAVEAVPADESGQVLVKGSNDGADLVLSVKDNGVGIRERDRARVFDAFYTTKEVGHGMGMGLTIARRVVLAMGGTLSLKSRLGAGSEFVVRVPRLLPAEAAG